MRPWSVHRFERIDSTNRWLVDEAQRGAPSRTVAVADEQTAGRGRLGRTWTAPAGSALLMSVLLRPAEGRGESAAWPVESWPVLTFAVAEAARRAARARGASTVTLKWPNDLLAVRPDGEERKLAGVLAQAVHGPSPAVVIGIGCNLARPAEVPDDVAARGVWLDELGVEVAPAALLDEVLAALDELVPLGPARLVDEVRRHCATLGRAVRVELPQGELRGIAVDLTPDGALLVDDGATVHALTVGDVVHVR